MLNDSPNRASELLRKRAGGAGQRLGGGGGVTMLFDSTIIQNDLMLLLVFIYISLYSFRRDLFGLTSCVGFFFLLSIFLFSFFFRFLFCPGPSRNIGSGFFPH